jgi:predicted DNA-binding transcriptional regulator AlpA
MARARRHHIDQRAARLADEIQAGGDPDQLLSDNDLHELTGLSTAWFRIGRTKGYAPPFVRLSPRVVMTKRSDYVAWLRERTHLRTSEYIDTAVISEAARACAQEPESGSHGLS